jgi:hypothetical protein
MAYGHDSYLADQFRRWEDSQIHHRGCDFHEDAPELARDRKTKQFRKKECTCHVIEEDQKEEAMGW